MPVSLEQWRASVGAINAGRSCVLTKHSTRGHRGSSWSGDMIQRILLFLLVMAVCGGLWLVLEVSTVARKAVGDVKMRNGLRQCSLSIIFLWECLSCFAMQILSLDDSLQRTFCSPSSVGQQQHKIWSLTSESGSIKSDAPTGCSEYLSDIFPMVVIDALLYLSGDVETNPGPLFSLVRSHLKKLHLFLEEVESSGNWRQLMLRLGVSARNKSFVGALDEWLRVCNPTWDELIAALANEGYTTLAQQALSLKEEQQLQERDMTMQQHDAMKVVDPSSQHEQPSRECPKCHLIHDNVLPQRRGPRPYRQLQDLSCDTLQEVHKKCTVEPKRGWSTKKQRAELQLELEEQQFLQELEKQRQELEKQRQEKQRQEKQQQEMWRREIRQREMQQQEMRKQKMRRWQKQQLEVLEFDDEWNGWTSHSFGFNEELLQGGRTSNIDIWKGHMEIPDIDIGLPCLCKVAVTDIEAIQLLLPRYWPKRMIMKVYSMQIYRSMSKQMEFCRVTFKFDGYGMSMLDHLRMFGTQSKCAIVQLKDIQFVSKCPIKALILIWDGLRGQFNGMIPLDQTKFTRVMKEVFVSQKLSLPEFLEVQVQQPRHQQGLKENPDDISQEDAKRLFFEAMEKGFVTSQSIVIVLIGIAGSGKSSFKRVVLNLPPEDKRVSTPLAEATIRNISISRAIVDDSESVEWEVITPEELLTMLADAIKKGVPQESSESNPKSDVNSSGSADNSKSMNSSDTVSELTSASIKSLSLDESKPSSHDVTSEQQCEDDDIELDDSILQLITKSKGSRKQSLLDVHWVYIIDTGGQPQFLQLLPAFIRNISSCVCFARLDQGLDDRPLVKFFDQSGEQCGKSYPSERTNFQVIESCVRTIHSRCCLNSESSPNFFIVGTHHDEYKKHSHPETIAMKNERLIDHLSPLLEESLTFFEVGDDDDDYDKLIFPLNCKKPGVNDRSIAAEFRKCVMKHCKEPKCEIPLAWFVLEQHIRQYATKKNYAYVEKATCLKFATKLNMSNKIFQAALNHLLKLNIFRSYSSLPDLIFCDTQVILLKLTELVQYSFELRRANISGISGEERNFKNEGIISLQFLSSHFDKFYSSIFTPECFLKILRELLAIADMDKNVGLQKKYFLPCLLKELAEEEISKYRGSSKDLSTLLLRLDDGCIPNGLFTSLISALKNDHQWCLHYRKHKPTCLYQNCVMFAIPGQLPGSITLIAAFEYIEVHVKCEIESKLDAVCATAYADIKSGLEASWKVLYPGTISFQPAFFCSSCVSSSDSSTSSECHLTTKNHYASISECGEAERCSNNLSCGRKLSESKIRWLKIMNYNCAFTEYIESADASWIDNSSLQSYPFDIDPSSSSLNQDLKQALSFIPETQSHHLDQLLDWDNDGVDKDLITIAKHMTEWEEVLAVYLKLKPSDISDIKSKNPKKPELQRREALQKWKAVSGLSATYRQLFVVFVEAGYASCVTELIEVLKSKKPLSSLKRRSEDSLPDSKRKKL